MDERGNICAVGYLLAQTAGIQKAEDLNKKYKYSKIEDINSDVLNSWAEKNGVTKTELAMIQPSYGYRIRNWADEITPAQAFYSSFNLGIALGTSMISLRRDNINKGFAYAGIGAGFLNTIFQFTLFNDDSQPIQLTLINTGAGIASIIFNAAKLTRDYQSLQKTARWNYYFNAIPDSNKKLALGIGISRHF